MLSKEKIKTIVVNVLYLLSGNIAIQLLGFVFNIYIARKLGASEYGVFNTISAFTAMFAFITLDGYQKVAIRECGGHHDRLKETIENIMGIKAALSLFAVLITIVASFLCNYDRQVSIFISIYSFTLFFNSIRLMSQVVYHVNFKVKYIAYTDVLQKLVYIIPAGICIWFDKNVGYLVTFFMISTGVNLFVNLYIIQKTFSIKFDLKNIINAEINYPFLKQAFIFSLLGFITFFYDLIDIAMLSWMVSSESVGIYSAGYKLVAPMQMINRILRVSFFPQFIQAFEGKKIKASQLFKMSFLTAACLIPVAMIMTLFAEPIILTVFGKEYQGAASVLKYLVWLVPFGTMTFPFVLSMQANHHEKKLILPNIVRAVSNIVFNYIFIKKYGYMGAVYSTVLTYLWYYIFINFGYQYYVLKKAGNLY